MGRAGVDVLMRHMIYVSRFGVENEVLPKGQVGERRRLGERIVVVVGF